LVSEELVLRTGFRVVEGNDLHLSVEVSSIMTLDQSAGKRSGRIIQSVLNVEILTSNLFQDQTQRMRRSLNTGKTYGPVKHAHDTTVNAIPILTPALFKSGTSISPLITAGQMD
jgi:hypothetical protein